MNEEKNNRQYYLITNTKAIYQISQSYYSQLLQDYKKYSKDTKTYKRCEKLNSNNIIIDGAFSLNGYNQTVDPKVSSKLELIEFVFYTDDAYSAAGAAILYNQFSNYLICKRGEGYHISKTNHTANSGNLKIILNGKQTNLTSKNNNINDAIDILEQNNLFDKIRDIVFNAATDPIKGEIIIETVSGHIKQYPGAFKTGKSTFKWSGHHFILIKYL